MELLLLGGAVLVLAAASVVRLLLVPVLAWLWVLTHRRRRPLVQQVEAHLPALVSSRPIEVEPTLSLADLAEELLALPAAELRKLAGIRRRCSKRETVAMLLAMPI